MVEMAKIVVDWSISKMGKSNGFELVRKYHHLTDVYFQETLMDLRGSLLAELVR